MKLLSLFLFLAACTSNSSKVDTSEYDPRCVAACPETMPDVPNAGPVCDAASRTQCLDECQVRIAGLANVCQSCLLEKACFDPGCGSGGTTTGGSCNETTCTIESEFGSCTYPTNDDAAYRACLVKIDPRREVTCAVKFRPTTECAALCT